MARPVYEMEQHPTHIAAYFVDPSFGDIHTTEKVVSSNK